MNSQELRDVLTAIRLGEDSKVEFKEVVVSGKRVKSPLAEDLADELAAMGNTLEGTVLLGVRDKDREVVGIPHEELDQVELFVRNLCNDQINPPLLVTLRRLEVPDSKGDYKAILRVEVPRSLFVHRSPKGYLYRLGSSKREMSPEHLARLFQQRSQARILRFDEQAVPGTNLSTLDPALYRRFFQGMEGADEELLRKMHLLVAGGDQDGLATVSGVLLCSHQPHEYLKSALIQAVAYGGTERDAATQVDAQDITGPLDRQILDALRFVERNMKVPARKDLGREDRPQYSLRALLEALVNAVAHRDYSIYGSKIRLHLFADRLELSSPGALSNTMTVESMPLRQSTRNELIASLLARCPVEVEKYGRRMLMDKRGEGVPIILKESLRLSGRESVFEVIDDSEVRVTMYPASIS
jgi:predicted HTH transcriptional regulator